MTIERRKCGRGFGYFAKNGRRIRNPRVIERLARLAVPPAYVDVAYSAGDLAPLQAMGRDAAGRWQYRYYPNREKQRERRKARHLIRLIERLARTERGASERGRKRQVKQAIQLAADDLANTAAICRQSYVHEAVIDAFEKGTLNGNGKASKRPPPARQILADVVNAHAAR